MPEKFQLAIQGGGARMAELLAAAEVIQRFETQGRIQVTKIAGTSAGSIVGALLAINGQDSIEKARDYLDRHADRIAEVVVPPGSTKFGVRTFWKLYRNEALCGGASIRHELLKLFQHVFGRQTGFFFKDLQKEMIVVAADLVNRNKHTYSAPNENLIEALVNSCAIPLVFRGASEMQGNPYVDGGLCENLPSGELSKDTKKFGEIIALSFPDYVDGLAPTTTLKFIYELFSTAINNSVQRATSQLRQEAVLSIPSQRTTLQFKGAFDRSARTAEFEVIDRRTSDWLERNIDRKGRPTIYRNNEAAENLMGELFDWYEASQAHVPRRSIRNAFVVKANSLVQGVNPKSAADAIQKIYHFAPIDVPLNCIIVGIGIEEQQSFLRHRVKVRAPDGGEVKTRLVPVIDRAQGDYEGYLVFFEPALPPMTDEHLRERGPYKAVYEAAITGGMANLVLKGEDDITNINSRKETFERVEVVFFAPDDFNYYAMPTLTVNGVKQTGGVAEMTDAEIRNTVGDGTLGFKVAGWKAENFVSGSSLRIGLIKKPGA